MTRTRKPGISRRSTLGLMGAGAVTFATPWVARAQAKTIKVGMPTILSGRVAQLGTSSRNAVMLEIEKVNAAGGLAGRQIEMVIRDSKGQPQEAARVARELVNTDGCEILIDAEASSGAFAVHEVARDLGVLCIHTNSETSALTADPKQHIPNAFRTARQGVHDSIVGGSYAAAIAKAKGLKKWATCSPDYAYGRDTTGEFTLYLKRFAPDVAIALSLPDFTCGTAARNGRNAMCTSPCTTPSTFSAAPLYGTCVRGILAITRNSSPAKWFVVPAPDEPKRSPPGCVFAYAINSFTE